MLTVWSAHTSVEQTIEEHTYIDEWIHLYHYISLHIPCRAGVHTYVSHKCLFSVSKTQLIFVNQYILCKYECTCGLKTDGRWTQYCYRETTLELLMFLA